MQKKIQDLIVWLTLLPLIISILFVNIKSIWWFNLFTWILIFYVLLWVVLFILNLSLKKKHITEYIRFIALFIILLIPVLFFISGEYDEIKNKINPILRIWWKISFIYLWLALSVSPIIKIFNIEKYSNLLLEVRKILWILTFMFFVNHWLSYFLIEYNFYDKFYANTTTYIQYVIKNLWYRYDALSWIIVWIMMLVLWLTSNKLSVSFLWKKWKFIHSFIYILFIWWAIHIALSWRMSYDYALIIIWVVALRTYSFLKDYNKARWDNKSWYRQYICVPCWYIYDERFWDPDWWLSPWTKFEDIPDDWVCPVCWAAKKDFEFLGYVDDEPKNRYTWKIIKKNFLTNDVVELVLEFDKSISYKPGQFVKIVYKDIDWEFTRSYSIAFSEQNKIGFVIKTYNWHRWSAVLKNIKIWENLDIEWPFGDFILKDTENKKIFLAAWTWLSPLYNMMLANKKAPMELYFTVRYEKDLFYLDKLKNIPNLKTHIYLTKENTSENTNYNYWRLNISDINIWENDEIYICWNPSFVEWMVNSLKEKWYKNIYFEKYH